MIKKILVVDDEPNIVKVIKLRLEANNYEVVAANDGKECLRKVVSEKPDLIILDIMMPVMDGFDVLIALKESAAIDESMSKVPPVIVLTAAVTPRIRELIEQEHIQAFITKPFVAADLLGTIKKISEGKP